jgi:hypothetical protein
MGAKLRRRDHTDLNTLKQYLIDCFKVYQQADFSGSKPLFWSLKNIAMLPLLIMADLRPTPGVNNRALHFADIKM